MREGRTWNRDEFVLALELYLDENCVCDSGDIQVRELAAPPVVFSSESCEDRGS